MYTWSWDSEEWSNSEFDTIEECIEDAAHGMILEPNDYIYVGTIEPFIPHIEAEDVLEDMMDVAYNKYDEASFTWEAYDYKEVEELDELTNNLNQVILDWLNKYNRMPHFGAVINIEKVQIA